MYSLLAFETSYPTSPWRLSALPAALCRRFARPSDSTNLFVFCSYEHSKNCTKNVQITPFLSAVTGTRSVTPLFSAVTKNNRGPLRKPISGGRSPRRRNLRKSQFGACPRYNPFKNNLYEKQTRSFQEDSRRRPDPGHSRRRAPTSWRKYRSWHQHLPQLHFHFLFHAGNEGVGRRQE